MDIIYHKKIEPSELTDGTRAEVHLFCIQILDINSFAGALIAQINDTSWISQLNFVGRMSYEDTAKKTIESLVKIFSSVDGKIKSDFGEFLISLSSGNCLKDRHSHTNLPISELWKEKNLNNHGFDFHTISPADRISFGEAKYQSSGNAYTSAAEQTHRFSREGKDKIDAVHLRHFSSELPLKNLEDGKKGYVVAFSVNSEDHVQILSNSLENEDIISLSNLCDELYIIGVKA